MSLPFYSNYTAQDFAIALQMNPNLAPPGCINLARCTFIFEQAEPNSYPTGLTAGLAFFVFTLVASNKTRGQTLLPQLAAAFYVVPVILLQVGNMYATTYFPGPNRTALRAVAWIFDYLARTTVVFCFYRLYHDFDKYFAKGLQGAATDAFLPDIQVPGHLINFRVDATKPYLYQRVSSFFVFGLNLIILIYVIAAEATLNSVKAEQVWYGVDIAWIVPFIGLGYKIFRTLNYNIMTTNLQSVNNPVLIGLANPANSFLLNRITLICVFSIFCGVSQTVLWSITATGYVFDYNHIWYIMFYGSRLVALELLCGCFDQMAYHVEKATRSASSTSSSGTKQGTTSYMTSEQKNPTTAASSYYQSQGTGYSTTEQSQI